MIDDEVREFKVEIKEIKANGMTFQCRVCGLDNIGEPIILLHGFPESSYMWEKTLKFLAAQGYRCLAPDLRGYSPKARPKGIQNYRIDKIASDVVALADILGFQKFHLVAHDWGAGCGWTLVELYPNLVNSWSVLSVPHMEAWYKAKKNNCDQIKLSWYITLFQIPIIPELFLGIATSIPFFHKFVWKESDTAAYANIFSKFVGRKSIINWYRANYKLPIPYGKVAIPTVLIWGNKDIAFARSGIEDTINYMETTDYKLVEINAGHTLVQDAPDKVRDEIFKHIQKHPLSK
jgi:pimeloyl-ACP methyl ester carboxylesterase